VNLAGPSLLPIGQRPNVQRSPPIDAPRRQQAIEMNEQRLNDFLGDNEDKHLGTGWWANVLSAFFGALAFGGVLCLYFPQLLTTPELRAHYPVDIIRLLI